MWFAVYSLKSEWLKGTHPQHMSVHHPVILPFVHFESVIVKTSCSTSGSVCIHFYVIFGFADAFPIYTPSVRHIQGAIA